MSEGPVLIALTGKRVSIAGPGLGRYDLNLETEPLEPCARRRRERATVAKPEWRWHLGTSPLGRCGQLGPARANRSSQRAWVPCRMRRGPVKSASSLACHRAGTSRVTIDSRATEALRDGRALAGYFSAAGVPRDVPGVLSWSFVEGARLELVAEADGWPPMGSPHFVVHGCLRDAGEVSLLHTWVKATSAFEDQVLEVRSSTLALGEHVNLEKTWERVAYSTANLTEWRRDTGLVHLHPAPKTRPNHVRIDWQPPATHQVNVPGARLIFRGTREYAVEDSADACIKTRQDLVVGRTDRWHWTGHGVTSRPHF